MKKIALTVLFLAGCAGQPTIEQVMIADAGQAPGSDFATTVKLAVQTTMIKDPKSLQEFSVGAPRKCGWREAAERREDAEYGYCAMVKFTAAGSSAQQYKIFYRDGRVLWWSPVPAIYVRGTEI